MTELGPSHLSESMREATDCAITAVDALIRDLGLRPSHPIAVALEAQREIIFALGRLGAIVGEVSEAHNDALVSPTMMAAVREGGEQGAEAGFKHVASEMRRRTLLHSVILVAGMFAFGGMGMTIGFTAGRNHELTTIAADCLHSGSLTPAGARACSVLMSPSTSLSREGSRGPRL